MGARTLTPQENIITIILFLFVSFCPVVGVVAFTIVYLLFLILIFSVF